MTRRRRWSLLFTCAIVAVAGVTQARQSIDRVYVGFDGAVRLPGVTLPPGTYIFLPAPSVGGQLVIDIYLGDASASVATVLAVESRLPRPAHRTLSDYPGTDPPYLRSWFPAGGQGGYDFVYAPSEAAGVYAASGVSVPASVFHGSRVDLVGVLPVEHVDNRLFSVGVRDVELPPPTAAVGPIDRLTIARLVVLSHLPDVPPAAAARLRLLDSQLRELLASYRIGRGDLIRRLSQVETTLDDTEQALASHDLAADTGTVHVLERVRAQVDGFERFFR